MQSEKFAKVTTIVNNNVFRKGLASSWGLSFYVETCTNDKRHSVLMDTSGSFQAFIGNASKLGLNLSEVEAILISHWHSDHYGALSQVLPLIRHSAPVYIPSTNNSGIRKIMNANGEPVVCSKPMEFTDGLMSTGEIPNGISEHSLLVNVKNKGLVVSVGCSHQDFQLQLTSQPRFSADFAFLFPPSISVTFFTKCVTESANKLLRSKSLCNNPP
jgi:metal-dependent hydrolase (beta-lactamase superfamily II)